MAFNVVGPVTTPPGLPGGIKAALDITAAEVVKSQPGICVAVSCIAAGDITLNDTTTTGGASDSNAFYNASMTEGQVETLNWPCASGIVVSAATGAFAISFS